MTMNYVSEEDVHYLYKEIFVDQAYLRHGIRICPASTVIDVGANVGLFSIFAASKAGPEVRTTQK